MTRCSQEALEVALRQLSEHAASGRARANWISAFLVAKRIAAAGYASNTIGANSGTNDVFVMLPNNPGVVATHSSTSALSIGGARSRRPVARQCGTPEHETAPNAYCSSRTISATDFDLTPFRSCSNNLAQRNRSPLGMHLRFSSPAITSGTANQPAMSWWRRHRRSSTCPSAILHA